MVGGGGDLATKIAGSHSFRLLLLGLCQTECVQFSDIEHLKARIIEAVESDVLSHVWQELKYLLDVCRATNRTHIELS